MQLHTFQARSLPDALRLVRERLGPDASVLHTREVGGLVTRWLGGGGFEVTASAEIRVPSRLPPPIQQTIPASPATDEVSPPPADLHDFRRKFREALKHEQAEPSLVEGLCRRVAHPSTRLPIHGPIRLEPGRRKVVALVGPTGVGKTTTIAKLAAHFRLQEQCRVGLVTVDTFRIAAVAQLRAYAEIMDLSLEVVATPGEMRGTIDRMNEFDLVLIDTAGRSPRDAARIQELRSVLAAAGADEVHLVLSAAAGPESISAAAEAFATVDASALVMTKLDEAASLDWLPRLLHKHSLPLSYTTNGQNVPHDILPASAAAFLTPDS